jgi:2-hydroxy-3-keto-5-methylthiopentenyl-1-phosphate phosphatase
MTHARYNAVLSSDWNECLAPCGPFDCISFSYPELEAQLAAIFRQYTGNRISLREAVGKIQRLLPDPVTPEQMDAYLDASFVTYPGVADLIEWCLSNNILFMINTTGMIGYFQRIFAKGLLPGVPVLSANPLIRFSECSSDPRYIYEVFETPDKGKNTASAMQSLKIPAAKVILLGDSGGDGPHFEWGSKVGAFLVGTMTKPSLDRFCREKNIFINLRFGPDYSSAGKKDERQEMQVNFMDLKGTIEDIIAG